MNKNIIIVSILAVAILTTACSKVPDAQVETTANSTEVSTEITSEVITEEITEETTEIQEEKIVLHDTEKIIISILGMESFKELKSDKSFIDKTEDGEEYLVIYLEIENLSTQADYFNYSYLQTEIDGNIIETTYLMNKPKNYETILSALPAETMTQGYLVYKVPVGWKNLKVSYNGWEAEGGKLFEFELTPSDLKEVEAYVNPTVMP